MESAHVTATLAHLDVYLRTMVEIRRLTGMRPDEVCGMTLAGVDRGNALWLYRLAQQTAHYGRQRVIPIGPKAQAALVAFLLRDGSPLDGFAHINLNDPDQRDARCVMADAYQEADRERDAVVLRDTTRAAGLVTDCVVDPIAREHDQLSVPQDRVHGSGRHCAYDQDRRVREPFAFSPPQTRGDSGSVRTACPVAVKARASPASGP